MPTMIEDVMGTVDAPPDAPATVIYDHPVRVRTGALISNVFWGRLPPEDIASRKFRNGDRVLCRVLRQCEHGGEPLRDVRKIQEL